MNLWAALAGGFAGTLVLTTTLRAASELGLTRMDLPFLLGAGFTGDRSRAKLIGYACHFGLGIVFALVYGAVFAVIHRAGWRLGASFGVIHAIFVGTVVVNVLLPAVHPRMGTPTSAANETPLLEPPGFMMLNYGRTTPLVSLAGHILYGAIVGAFVSMAR
jgi:hypothetical protein